MIDHVLGRPSIKFRKYQVGLAVAFWSAYLFKGNQHGPPGARRISDFLTKRLTAWQTMVITLLWLYVARNFGKIVGLESPEPLANLYTRSYFRATYVMTALDAGFWSAMRIKRKWLRDILSIVFSIYYLVCAEQADEKVRKVRSTLTVEHLRVGWNKVLTPYLSIAAKLTRPRLMRHSPRALRIPRPSSSSYNEPVQAWLYFEGPLSALKKHTKVVLNIPGGGFISMSPRTHDDSLMAWASKTGLPVLSLDYKKAPEYPYPYALNECFDVYCTLIASRGRCINLSGETVPQIVVSGDSAGGNLATGLTLMALQTRASETAQWQGRERLPVPAGLVLIYPALDMNIGNWMSDEQMTLIRDRTSRNTNRRIVRHKSRDFRKLTPATPIPSDDSDSDSDSPPKRSKRRNTVTSTKLVTTKAEDTALQGHQPLRTRLAMPSIISYVNDRILTPEMLRAMIILYVGPHNKPDFSTEYLMSPVLAPDSLLAHFPKTYFMTGERDPLVDDTVIMAGRIRAAKLAAWRDKKEMGMLSSRDAKHGFEDKDHVHVKLVEGISHGFIQFGNVYPEAWGFIFQIGRWYEECFAAADQAISKAKLEKMHDIARQRSTAQRNSHLQHRRSDTGASSGDEDKPLEMSLKLTRTSPSPDSRREGDKPASSVGVTPGISVSNSFDTMPPTPFTAGSDAGQTGDDDRRGSGSSDRRKSLVSMASEDDLMARRMKGLAGGLTRVNPDI